MRVGRYVTMVILVMMIVVATCPVDEEYPEEQECFHSRFLD